MGTPVWPAQIAVKALMEEGFDTLFGITGGHINSFDDYWTIYGNRLYHMRHEQACGYAAEAYARATGKPGLAMATVGPGTCNIISAINQQYWNSAPVVTILGQVPRNEYDRFPFQPVRGEQMLSACTKWTKRIETSAMIAYYIRKACRDAMTYPPGPVAIEIPTELLVTEGPLIDPMRQVGWVKDWRKERAPIIEPDEELVEKMVDMIFQAQRPILVLGNGAFWANAGDEIREFSEMADIPCHGRRSARGIVPEGHRLHISGASRGRAFGAADLCVTIGLRFDSLERRVSWGNGKLIQVNEASSEIHWERPTELEIIGNAKAVVAKMIEVAKMKYAGQKKTAWVEEINKINAESVENMRARCKQIATERSLPCQIHPDPMALEIADFLSEEAPDTTVILDSFSASSYLTDKFMPRFAGAVMDAGIQGGVGHGVGMAIGAQVGHPGKPVLAMLGDAGIGLGGFDIETAYREDLPVVYVVYNNGCWIGGWNAIYGKDWHNLEVNPHVRDTDRYGGKLEGRIEYGRMFEVMGCHGEEVRTYDEIKPALRRAFNSGKTSIVNIHGDPDAHHTVWDRYFEAGWSSMCWHIPEELWSGDPQFKERCRKVFQRRGYENWPKFPKHFPPFDAKEDFQWK